MREMHSCVHACVTAAVQLAVHAILDRPQSDRRTRCRRQRYGNARPASNHIWCTRWTAVTHKCCLRGVASLLAPFAVPCSACNTLRLIEGLHKQLPSCFLPRARSKYRHPTVNDSIVCDEQVIAGPDSRLLLSLIRCEGMRNGVQ